MSLVSIAREGYLSGVLSIATRGYIGAATTPGGGDPPAATETFYLLLENGDRILLEGGDGFLLLEGASAQVVVAEPGIPITNSTVFFPAHSGYTICDRSGKKALPGELVKDPYSGGMVLPQFVDEYIPEHVRARERANGSQRPEQDLNWITTPITSDDL